MRALAELYPRLWFRRFRPVRPGVPTLVCLPHAGGVAGTFHDLAALLSPDIEVLAVQYPGRQDRLREPAITEATQLASAIGAVLPLRPDHPVALFGHSYGALLAHRLALQMARRGDPPCLVLLSAHGPQMAPRSAPIHQLEGEAFLAAIRELSAAAADLLRDPTMAELALPALRADLIAAETYAIDDPALLQVPLTAICGDKDLRAPADAVGRWRQFAGGSFDLVRCRGGHLYFLDDPKLLAQLIRSRLAMAVDGVANGPPFR
jgi:pyochelin biosynthetic protein PchC